MARTIGIGIQDFGKIIENDCFYVDKTYFIKEWWESRDEVTLITRPRRFGKTLTMSMTEQFFSVKYAGRADLFEGLAIWQDEKFRALQGSLVGKLIREGSRRVKESFQSLLQGEHLVVPIDEQIIYDQLDNNENAVWSLLVASGYLKVLCYEQYETDEILLAPKYELALTNYEVKVMFKNMVRGWFGRNLSDYNDFIKALLLNDLDAMNEYMNRVACETFSFFDSGKRASGKTEPERFYHGFVLGLMVELEDRYAITSNRESGFGRYDIMLEPKEEGMDAFIIEFKVYRPEKDKSFEDTVNAALAQIEEKQYAAALTAKGIPESRIQKYGFAFEGKKVLIG